MRWRNGYVGSWEEGTGIYFAGSGRGGSLFDWPMRRGRAVLGVFSCMHFLVDAVCAFVMYGVFQDNDAWYGYLLLYNFCAFALQMPLGVVFDGICRGKSVNEKYRLSAGFAVLGAGLTLLGGFTHVTVLGLGNALFHVGGGVGTIWTSEREGSVCTRLGVFVAPGALGLFWGKVWSQSVNKVWIAWAGALVLLCLGGALLWICKGKRFDFYCGRRGGEGRLAYRKSLMAVCCFLVVVLRSYVGMAAAFPWKNTVLMGAVCTVAVAGGKAAGGFLADRIGIYRTVVISLILAAGMYGLGGFWGTGLLALLFFNMTMPLTLYLMWKEMREQPGLAFGVLTFALFLGFLPVYFQTVLPIDYRLTGSLGSLLSLVMLAWAVGRKGEADGSVSG